MRVGADVLTTSATDYYIVGKTDVPSRYCLLVRGVIQGTGAKRVLDMT